MYISVLAAHRVSQRGVEFAFYEFFNLKYNIFFTQKMAKEVSSVPANVKRSGVLFSSLSLCSSLSAVVRLCS